jgi:hypothetical protein
MLVTCPAAFTAGVSDLLMGSALLSTHSFAVRCSWKQRPFSAYWRVATDSRFIYTVGARTATLF